MIYIRQFSIRDCLSSRHSFNRILNGT